MPVDKRKTNMQHVGVRVALWALLACVLCSSVGEWQQAVLWIYGC